jgi:glucose/mannose-6-phosphate isomerase
VIGVGAGGIAGAAAAALSARHSSVPIWVGAGPSLPAFVDSDTLVLAVSCSGSSSTTIAATAAALDAGSPVVVVAPDGALGTLGDRAVARCPIGPPGPAGRSELDPEPSVRAAAAPLARRRDRLFEPGGPAEQVARQIGRTIPLVYGSAGVFAVAARRWKAQINLNAKTPAFCAALPEVVHEELAGWGQSGDVTRQVVSLVLLRHDDEDAETARMFDVVSQATDEVMAGIVEVKAEGDDDLARFVDLTLFGDVVSLYLAEREGVDPGPVPTVDEALGEVRAF